MKKQNFHILLLFSMDSHQKKTKTALHDLFQKLHEKEKTAKRFRSLLILNAFQILNDLLYT